MKCKNCRNIVKRRDDDGTLYDWCGMIVDCPDRDLERDCKYYQGKTNADCIRAMSDDELAILLEGCICPSEPCKKVVNRERQPDKKMCQLCWLDWLKQEG